MLCNCTTCSRLSQCFVRNLPSPDLPAIARHLTKHDLPPRSAIFWQGQEAKEAFIVCEGSVKLVSTDESGAERIAKFVWPGEFFGLDSLLQRMERPFAAITRERSQIVRIDLDYFRRLILSDPGSFSKILDYFCSMVMNMSVEKLDMSGERIQKRLRKVLARMRVGSGSERSATEEKRSAITQHELGEFLGVAEETISREMKKLRQKDLKREHGRAKAATNGAS
jgi:CRP/FNR family transcriptional regulator, anaerobic regulatory protein